MKKDELVTHIAALGELRDSLIAGTNKATSRKLSKKFDAMTRLNMVETYTRMKKAVDAATQMMLKQLGETP